MMPSVTIPYVNSDGLKAVNVPFVYPSESFVVASMTSSPQSNVTNAKNATNILIIL